MRPAFYVYHLIDPTTGAVFYVGKGCRDRIAQHEHEARRLGATSPKTRKIIELWASGATVTRHIVQNLCRRVVLQHAEYHGSKKLNQRFEQYGIHFSIQKAA